ncbi:MAG: hypothetical protein EA370_04065, partial [Wenzhouxiangella sp.]
MCTSENARKTGKSAQDFFEKLLDRFESCNEQQALRSNRQALILMAEHQASKRRVGFMRVRLEAI